jgi:hypothetical protein
MLRQATVGDKIPVGNRLVNTSSENSESLRRMLVSILRGAVGSQPFIYLSGPITTGRRFVQWQREAGTALTSEESWRAERQKAVIRPNCTNLYKAAEALRSGGQPVIEPGCFEIEGRVWKQEDYYQLWDQVITEHAAGVRFLEGWQYSAGCVVEYGSAQRNRRPTYTQSGKPLSRAAALNLVDAAVSDLADEDVRIAKLRDDLLRHRGDIEGS